MTSTALKTTESTSAARSVKTPERQKPRSRIGLVLIAAAMFGAAGLVYLVSRAAGADHQPGPAPMPPPKVTVAPVEQRTLTDHRELLGRVDATETVEVRPRVSGHIDEVRLHAGDIVKKGDVLFVIDPRWYRAQFDLATAAVERAKVRLQIAEREARRSEGLLANRTISVEEADTRTTRRDEARTELLSAEAALATARLDLEYTEVRAPITGRVSRAYVTAGNLVSGSPGGAALLTSIVSVGEVYVYADVDEATLLSFNRLIRDGGIVTENGHVPVEMGLSDETGFVHRGYIESADNRLDPGTGSLVLRMVFPNPDGQLIPGLFARVRLPVSAPQAALLISERAIGTDQSQKYVFTVADDNKVAYRTVKLGPVIDGKRIVREGLRPGERVIINGLQRARPGITVTPEIEPSASTVALK